LQECRQRLLQKQPAERLVSGIDLPQEPTGGRPCFVIDRDQLKGLHDLGFTAKAIAELLNVSLSTVMSKMRY
jgi:hypothetical protein